MNYYLNNDLIEVGLDECARGCLFGRIYAAAVIFPKENNNNNKLEKIINDSKKISKKKRELLFDYIKERALDYSICWIDNNEIDKKGIQYCNMKLFQDCIQKLKLKSDYYLIDGTQYKPFNNVPHKCIKKGDTKYINIAAASILAKVAHDNYIKELVNNNIELEKYDLLNNMGYGTKKHRDAIIQYGITKYHRISYKPCNLYNIVK